MAAKRRKRVGVPLPPRAEAGATLTPEDVLHDAGIDVVLKPDGTVSYEENSHADDLRSVGRYIDELYEKQPRQLAKRARQVKIEQARETWQRVKAYMRALIEQGLSSEEILDSAELEFGDYDRETLRRYGLTGLRKELKKAGADVAPVNIKPRSSR
jgi:hypothetical protein